MIEINLLPTGEKRRPASRAGGALRAPSLKVPGDPYMVGLGAVGVLLLLGLGFAYWTVDTRMADARTRLDQAVADSTRFASTIQLVATLRARQDTIQRKIDVIRSVDEQRYLWPHVLDEIARAIPPYTWLTKVAAVEEKAPAPSAKDTAKARTAAQAAPGANTPRFDLEGNTGSTQALTRFMKSLEASPFIRDVTLVTSAQVVTEGRSYQKFTLEARYEVPDSSFIETVPVVSVK